MGSEYSSTSSTGRARLRPRDRRGRSVYPHDAEDIKAHKWFRDIPWGQLHMITPPFVPHITSLEDTHYFDEEEPISDWSDSCSDGDTESENSEAPALEANPLAVHAPGAMAVAAADDSMGLSPFKPPTPGPHTGTVYNALPPTTIRRSPQKLAAMQAKLAILPRYARGALAQFIASPYDSARLKRMDREIDALVTVNATNTASTSSAQPPSAAPEARLADQMKAFIRTFGRRERKRPRDRLLRDRKTKATVLKVRKQTAFLGYTFRRTMNADTVALSTYDGAGRTAAGGIFPRGGLGIFPQLGGIPGRGPMTIVPAMGIPVLRGEVGGGCVGCRPYGGM